MKAIRSPHVEYEFSTGCQVSFCTGEASQGISAIEQAIEAIVRQNDSIELLSQVEVTHVAVYELHLAAQARAQSCYRALCDGKQSRVAIKANDYPPPPLVPGAQKIRDQPTVARAKLEHSQCRRAGFGVKRPITGIATMS